MANKTVNPLNHLTAEQIEEAGRVKPFTFHRKATEQTELPGGAVMSFVGKASDVSSGARQIFEILEWDDLRRSNVGDSDTPELEQQPVLTPYSRGVLMRFASTSLELLEAECDSMRTWAFECHTPEGRLERYEQALSCLKAHRQRIPSAETD